MEKLAAFIRNVTNMPFRIVKCQSIDGKSQFTVEFGELAVRVVFVTFVNIDKIYFLFQGNTLDVSVPNNAILLNDVIQLPNIMLD